MRVCPNCQYTNREGYMFCEECGKDITHVPGTYEAAPPGIALQVLGAEQPIPLRPEGQSVLGRVDADRPHQPDIDLSAYRALEHGISTLHAVIQQTVDGVEIVDMDSTNGTYVNGYRLIPEQPYLLNDGDEIRLSRLVTYIQINRLL